MSPYVSERWSAKYLNESKVTRVHAPRQAAEMGQRTVLTRVQERLARSQGRLGGVEGAIRRVPPPPAGP